MKKAFDNKKYLKIQSDKINERIKMFGDKLYLVFGGKLFDDFHASRVLPGFEPDSKLKVLLKLKDKAEIIIANSVHKFFRDDENIRLINEFESLGLNMNASGTNRALRSGHERNKPVQPSVIQEDRFRGKIFVFTGTLTSMTRNEAAERVMTLGGLFSNSVTLKTGYLVAGEKPGSKLRKAESLGVTILTEQEFLRMTEGS